MNKHLFLIIAFFAIACHSGQRSYPVYGHWQMFGLDNTQPLKASPKEIDETVYIHLNDTTLDAKGQYLSSAITRFNDKGELVYNKNAKDSLWNETVQWYDDNGFQQETSNSARKDSTAKIRRITTRRLADGRFEETISPDGHEKIINTISFKDSAGLVIMTSVSDTSRFQGYAVQVSEYNGNKLQRTTDVRKDGMSSSSNYVYDANNFLTAIVATANGKPSYKFVFFNNEHGDPIRRCQLYAPGDTLNDVSFQYAYDQQGNWIKQLTKPTIHTRDERPVIKGTDCSLTTREIKY